MKRTKGQAGATNRWYEVLARANWLTLSPTGWIGCVSFLVMVSFLVNSSEFERRKLDLSWQTDSPTYWDTVDVAATQGDLSMAKFLYHLATEKYGFTAPDQVQANLFPIETLIHQAHALRGVLSVHPWSWPLTWEWLNRELALGNTAHALWLRDELLHQQPNNPVLLQRFSEITRNE